MSHTSRSAGVPNVLRNHDPLRICSRRSRSDQHQSLLQAASLGGRGGCPRNRSACSSEIDTVADAVVHEHRVHPTGSLILMIAQLNRWSVALMSGVDGSCVRNMHPEVILNFGLYNSIISFGMFRFG